MYSQGQFVVKGAGTDIWGTADAFHFVYRPLQGDGQIIARTQGLEDIAGPFAKAGVMIRETLNPGSKHVVIDLNSDGGIEFMSRQTTGGDTAFFGGRTQHPPTWLKLIRHGGTITGSVSADSAHWFAFGDVGISMADTVYVGLVVTSHDASMRISSSFDNVLVNWNTQDVGSPIVAGSVVQENDAFTVKASGDDIWGAVDNFHFVSVPVTNIENEGIAVRIDSLQNTATFAKAGIMIRDSMDATSAQVIINVKPNGGVEFMRREQTSGSSEFIAGGTTTFPAYVSIAIASRSVSGFICDSNRQCTLVGTTTAALSPTSSIGLAVVSHNPAVLTTAVFGSVAVSAAR
jgi:regulation of enolase protein 1 (concanavalin A-like superfamily)